MPIFTPFLYISMHIVKAKRIWFVSPFGKTFPPTYSWIPVVCIKWCKFIPKGIRCCCSCPACILPFCFRWQSITTFSHCIQFLDKLLAIFPRYIRYWVLGPFSITWIIAHHLLPLFLRHRIFAHVIRIRKSYFMLSFIITSALFRYGWSHHEGACGN